MSFISEGRGFSDRLNFGPIVILLGHVSCRMFDVWGCTLTNHVFSGRHALLISYKGNNAQRDCYRHIPFIGLWDAGMLYLSISKHGKWQLQLSPPQRPLCHRGEALCVVGRLGRKKKRASPARFIFFSIIDILMAIPSGSLCGGESNCKAINANMHSKLFSQRFPNILGCSCYRWVPPIISPVFAISEVKSKQQGTFQGFVQSLSLATGG